MTRQRPRKISQKSSVLNDYQENLKKVRLLGQKSCLSESEINSVMDQCMQSVIAKERMVEEKKLLFYARKLLSILKNVLFLFMSFLVTILILYIVLQHKPTQYFIQSKLQDFIYPGMKILRKLFLPIISLYPTLTNYYDESCLVVNPFFRVPDMSCPCEDVRAILNLTGENTQREQYHSGIPFMIKISRDEVPWKKLKVLYDNHSSVFDRDASHLIISLPSSQSYKSTPSSLFHSTWNINDSNWDHTHVQWRSNRLEPTRLLRSIFGAPVGEPNYAVGVTIEKLVMIDGPKAPAYHMPTTDGTTVFIHQTSGSRVILLSPANECRGTCTAVSVELPPNHILWFSWWYWRASSLPSPASTSVSVTYMGSYL